MIILGINSAFEGASVAVVSQVAGGPARLLGEIFLDNLPPRTESLILDIKKFLALLKINLEKIEVISVVIGPGSYTGLRLGLTTAKTIAQIQKQKIVTVGTLENMAYQVRFLKGLFVDIIKATQKFNNLALFALKSGRFERLTADLIVETGAITKKLSQIKGDFYLAGDVPDIYDKIKSMNPKTRAILLDKTAVIPNSAAAAAFFGLAKAARGEFQKDFLALAPFYLHPVKITPGVYQYNFKS